MTRLLSWARPCLFAGSTALVACSPAVWRPLETTAAATELSQVTLSSDNELDPAVSPDARSIVFEVAPTLDAPPRIAVMSLPRERSGGTGTIEYSSGQVLGRYPTWMPDGTGVYFLSMTREGPRLMEMIGFGAGKTPLVADPGEISFAGEWPAVSPDGTTIAMSVGHVDTFQTGWRSARHLDQALGFAGPLGTAFRVSGVGTEPAWSPNGKQLAFVRASGGHAHLFVMNADGTDPQQITEGASDDEAPAWSPDGRRLVFCSTNVAVETRQANLFTVSPDGAGLVQLTEGDRYACHPAWGRDGFIYFHANATGRFHVWRLRPG
jgi:Tol biopolymer transport system component